MHGINLSDTSEQSNIALAVLYMVTELALRDTSYIDRLKHHYKLFRAQAISKMIDNNIKSIILYFYDRTE
jgi:hypothetical protein